MHSVSRPVVPTLIPHGVQAKAISSPPQDSELQWLEMDLVSSAVFGAPKISHLADLKAFTHGLTCAFASPEVLQAVSAVSLDIARRTN